MSDEFPHNPFAKHIIDGDYRKGPLRVVYSVFENALQVSIVENDGVRQHTLYSQNFFALRDEAYTLIEKLRDGTGDVDDLIFDLNELKEKESHGA